MGETTEPTREQLIEAIDGLVHDTDAPQWMCENEANGTHTDWTIAVMRMALRTLDAEAKLAAMTERAEKAERERDTANAYIAQEDTEVDTLRAKLAEVKKEAENLLWNLAGCDAIASSGTPTTFDDSMARPALHAVNQMATRLVDVERKFAAMTERAEKAEASATRGWEQADSLHASVKEQRERAEKAERDRVVLGAAIDTWGLAEQLRMLQEECGELVAAVNHFLRGRVKNDLYEEMADVWIVLDQMLTCSFAPLVRAARERKIARLAERLGIAAEVR